MNELKKTIQNYEKSGVFKIKHKKELLTLIEFIRFDLSFDDVNNLIKFFNILYNKKNYSLHISHNGYDLILMGYDFKIYIDLITKKVKNIIT